MKKILFLFIGVLLFWSCTSPKKTAKQTEAISLDGEFLYLNDAAVLNTGTDIYGVVIDQKLVELDLQTRPLQKDEYDMVQVFIKGIVTKNPNEEGWGNLVRIVAIDSVAPSIPENNSIIKLSTQ
ncbi:MAG: hypothetical protein P8L72_03170 [Flavobacteriaceae bacterium]|nr:hypothetical protein [Flavobacteriaceae bacterium]MDG2314369.1 hypothetical protein [Flavobacteriaceae bacterium]